MAITPNVESRGHQVFGEAWRALEPPRHLQIFSLRALQISTKRSGLKIEVLRTSARSGFWTWKASQAIRSKEPFCASRSTRWKSLEGIVFQVGEEALRLLRKDVGEELLLIATVG